MPNVAEKSNLLANVTIKLVHVMAEHIEHVALYGYRETKEAAYKYHRPEDGKKRPWACDKWSVTLIYHSPRGDTRFYTTSYRTGIGHRTANRNEAKGFYNGHESAAKGITAASVLESLFSDASSAFETFDQWCGEFGYDTDSRKALDCYLQCQTTATELRKLFGPDYAEIEAEVRGES